MGDRVAEADVLDYGQVAAALARAGSSAGAAAAHGILCGMLCVVPETTTASWLEEILGDCEPGEAAAAETRALLGRVRQQTEAQLASLGFEFRLLLPEPETSLGERSQALGEWCDGFLFGLGAAGMNDRALLSEEAREFIMDVADIARMEVEGSAGEGEEIALEEVSEYVRVGVILIYEDLREQRRPTRGDTFH